MRFRIVTEEDKDAYVRKNIIDQLKQITYGATACGVAYGVVKSVNAFQLPDSVQVPAVLISTFLAAGVCFCVYNKLTDLQDELGRVDDDKCHVSNIYEAEDIKVRRR